MVTTWHNQIHRPECLECICSTTMFDDFTIDDFIDIDACDFKCSFFPFFLHTKDDHTA